MKQLIAITTPTYFPDEGKIIISLFEGGLERLHLRKPEAGKESLAALLAQIPEAFYSRIVLHDHFSLAAEYALGGVHLNRRNPNVPDHFAGSISRSCHSLQELEEWKALDYLFLSPIFPSISKEGYGNGFPRQELEQASEKGIITSKVFALGGIDALHIRQLKGLGFGGAVVLGALWGNKPDENSREDIMNRFNQLTTAIKER